MVAYTSSGLRIRPVGYFNTSQCRHNVPDKHQNYYLYQTQKCTIEMYGISHVHIISHVIHKRGGQVITSLEYRRYNTPILYQVRLRRT